MEEHTKQYQAERPEMRGNHSMLYYVSPVPKEQRIEQQCEDWN